ncbi:MAG TPA: glycoside hydrolase family 9 protein [Chitinispirillaceae bacterium]|jgi:endoglucanase|nr:glycoside hydrolase family 9 protein [Chitinispirillaceae bacterium]
MLIKRLITKLVIISALLCLESICGIIHVNQEGYYPYDKKIGIAVGASSDTFSLLSAGNESVVFTGEFINGGHWKASDETTKIADFSNFTQPGDYKLTAPGCDESHAFKIEKNVHLNLTKASIKAFYYNRASIELEDKYAVKWTRPAGHADDLVEIHISAESQNRKAGSLISSPGGWYDAGDYGKYIVNSGITVHTLLAAYQAFSSFFDTLDLNIPESDNSLPDLVDEILWNLRWMITMQDPHDGGVYHKLTTADFPGDIMPDEDWDIRYVVQKSTAATLDFAAVTSQASRILRKFDNLLPGLADSCLEASLFAWKWARANPDSLFLKNPDGITTGTYSDYNVSDEFRWAATELYLTTRQDSFYTIAYPESIDTSYWIPGWNSVNILGLYSLFQTKDSLTSAVNPDQINIAIEKVADSLLARFKRNPYKTTMESDTIITSDNKKIINNDFYWGSNSVAANQGIALIFGYMTNKNPEYKNAVIGQLDYLLGKNPTGYCYVTGAGTISPMNIHHRPSTADRVKEPVPGFLAGGPHSGQNENVNCRGSNCITYPSALPALSYIDDHRSYSTNEIAINWNAPLVFLSAAMEALQNKSGSNTRYSKSTHYDFSPVLRIKNKKIIFSSPEKLTGEIIFTDLRGNIIARTVLNNQDKATVKASWSNQIIIAGINAKNNKGRKLTLTKLLNILHL